MDIQFKDLKKISQSLIKNNDKVLIDYLNDLDGDDVFQKFKNFLINWEQDVSSTLNLNLNDKPTKISLSYIISQMPNCLGNEIIIDNKDYKIILDIPKLFDILIQDDTIPIYSLIREINIHGISLNLIDLSFQEKKTIIDNLPAKLYSLILRNIIENRSKIVKFDNPLLSNFKFHFLTNEPLLFLKGLINNFGDDYYKDIIYLLSKKIDGEILMNSTPLELEYYIEKYSNEMESQNNGLQI